MNENLESQNSTLTPQVSVHKQRYLTLKREQLQAQRLVQSGLLQVKEENRQTAIDTLLLLAKTIERLRKKKKILKEAIANHKAIKILETDLRADVAKLSSWDATKGGAAKHDLNLNVSKQNVTLYFKNELENCIEVYENRKSKLESKLLKFDIKLDRAEKY